MTIYDISKKAGVSIATVSRVINGSDKVNEKTRQKVQAIIDECGFAPNVFARGLGTDSMKAVGILCADSSDIYLAKAVYYIERELKSNGYNTILACTGYELEGRKDALNMILESRVDCVILVGSSFIDPEGKENQYIKDAAARVPVMLLNADFDCENVFCTLCDDFKSTMDATEWLINNGKKRILYLYNSVSYSGIRKLSGFRSAILLHDLELNKDLVRFFEGDHEGIDEVSDYLTDLYKSGLSFDAILCSDDVLATGAVKFARKNKISVPNTLSIIGYNNSILTKACVPELTSVDNQLENQCNQLVKSCISILGGTESPQKTIFSGQLIMRETT